MEKNFPVEKHSLKVGELSILGGLHNDPSLGTHENDRGLGETWGKVCTWDEKDWFQLHS